MYFLPELMQEKLLSTYNIENWFDTFIHRCNHTSLFACIIE